MWERAPTLPTTAMTDRRSAGHMLSAVDDGIEVERLHWNGNR